MNNNYYYRVLMLIEGKYEWCCIEAEWMAEEYRILWGIEEIDGPYSEVQS